MLNIKTFFLKNINSCAVNLGGSFVILEINKVTQKYNKKTIINDMTQICKFILLFTFVLSLIPFPQYDHNNPQDHTKEK